MILKKYLFIFGYIGVFIAEQGLFLVAELGLLFVVVHRLLIVMTSLVAENWI